MATYGGTDVEESQSHVLSADGLPGGAAIKNKTGEGQAMSWVRVRLGCKLYRSPLVSVVVDNHLIY